MPFVVASAQFAPKKPDVAANLDTIAEIAEQAASGGADLLVLPETITSGYFLEGGVIDAARTPTEIADELARRGVGGSRPLDLCVGFYERGEGGVLYNSCAYFEARDSVVSVLNVYRKTFLPTYGVFDEERFVTRGRGLSVFDTRLGRLGMLICEDVWHSMMPTLCALRGAQTLLVPAASPARGFGKGEVENHDRYRRLFRAMAEEHGMWVVASQLVGFEGGKGFVGGSMVVDPFGMVRVEAPVGEAAMVMATVDPTEALIARAQTPLLSDLQGHWPAIQRLVAETE